MADTFWARLQASLDRLSAAFAARIPDLVFVAGVIAVFGLVAWAAPRLFAPGLRRAKLPDETVRLIGQAIRYGLVFLGFLAALDALDINFSALGIEISILGVAVGFALKDILTNLVSRQLILSTRPFVIGDQVRIKEFEGTVEHIGLRGTTLVTYDGRNVILPNIDVFTNPVTNNTASPLRRHSISLGVSFDANLGQVREIILGALAGMPDVAKDPAPDVLVTRIADFDVKLEVLIWTAALQSEVLRINSEATRTIYDVLTAHKIEIPLPTQVLKISQAGEGRA